MSSWRPILEGEDRARARAVVDRLAEAYRDAGPEPGEEADWVTLARGEPGIAIFCAYLAADTGEAEWGDLACQCLERAAASAPEMVQDPYLWTGLLGVEWAIEHVSALLGLGGAGEGDLSALLEQPDELAPFELYRGLAGVGVLALERLPHPDAARFLDQLVDKLGAMAEREADTVTWLSSPARLPVGDREAYPGGYHSLGVAHGVPGPLAVLAGAVAHRIAEGRARALLDGAIAWLARQRLPAGSLSTYPGLAGEKRASRPGWCYGDPGVALVLAECGRALGREDLVAEAIGLARKAAARAPAGSGLVDAPLCHGSAGLAHMLNRFHQVSGDDALRAGAQRWFRLALDAWQPERGARGFTAVGVAGEGDRAHVGLLDGSAGVGLALLAAISERPPDWDRAFAMSIAR